MPIKKKTSTKKRITKRRKNPEFSELEKELNEIDELLSELRIKMDQTDAIREARKFNILFNDYINLNDKRSDLIEEIKRLRYLDSRYSFSRFKKI